MVFVVGCLIVIAILLAISLWEEKSPPKPVALMPMVPPDQPSAPKVPEKNLTVTIKTRDPNFATVPSDHEFRYQDLKDRFQNLDGGQGYSGPPLEEILNLKTPFFQKIVAHDERGQTHEIGSEAAHWIIVIDKNNNPLTAKDGGPYALLNPRDPFSRVLRVERIEAI